MPEAKVKKQGLVDSWGRTNNRIYSDIECKICNKFFKPRKVSNIYCCNECFYISKRGPKPEKRKPITWSINPRGYVAGKIWISETKQKNIKQHRWVMEQHLGRKLSKDEDVHHINGVKTDNRIENLQILSHSDHSKLHTKTQIRRKGHKLNLSDEERSKRAERMKLIRQPYKKKY